MFVTNIEKTKILLQKLRRKVEAEMHCDEMDGIREIFEEYYNFLFDNGYGGNQNRYGNIETFKNWENFETKQKEGQKEYVVQKLPATYEKYALLSSLLGLTYNCVVALESESAVELQDCDISDQTIFDMDLNAKITKDGNIKFPALPVIRELAKDQSKGLARNEVFTRNENYVNEINGIINPTKAERLGGQNKTFFSLLSEKIKPEKIDEEVTNGIIRQLKTFRFNYLNRKNPSSIEVLRTFEYLTGIPLLNLYPAKQVEIETSFMPDSVDAKNERIIRMLKSSKSKLSKEKSIKLLSVANEFDFNIIKISDKFILLSNQQNKFGFMLFYEDCAIYCDCVFDFVTNVKTGIIVANQNEVKHILYEDIEKMPCIKKEYINFETNEKKNVMHNTSKRLSYIDITKGILELGVVAQNVLKSGNLVIKCDNIYYIASKSGEQFKARTIDVGIKSKYKHIVSYENCVARYGLVGDRMSIAPVYEEIIMEKNDFFRVKKGGLYGYINADGQTIIEPKFKKGYDVCQNKIAVFENGKFGYVNQNGETVIEHKFDVACNFKDGFATVGVNGKEGVINENGEFVINVEYDAIYEFNEGYAVFMQNDKYGYIDIAGKIVKEAQFDEASDVKAGKALVVKDGESCIVTFKKEY